MESDDIYKYLGLFIVVLFLVYIVIKTMNFQLKMVEGFDIKSAASSLSSSTSTSTTTTTDKDKVPDAIKSNTSKVSDSLLIDKYLRIYEDTIIDLDANIDMYLLQQVLLNAEGISADPGSDASQAIITKINNAKTFADSLNQAIKILDKK
jgi:hypothetical protein